jgi:Tol biopolymer transport system component
MSNNSPWPSPDGRSIVYVASDDQTCHICVMDRNGRNSRQLTSTDRFDFGPSYSPDGSKIIFARAARHRPAHWGGMTWDEWDIWQVNADGSALRQLTFGRYYSVDEPYFSPDGKHILFAAVFGEPFVSESHQLLTFDVGHDGSAVNLRPVPLPPQPEKRKYDGHPSFSPEGSGIIFTSLRLSRASPYDYEIWTAGIDGTNLRQITHNRSRNQNPIFSADGKFIYFTISGLDLYGLWRMRADGSEARQLIEQVPSPNDLPQASPRPSG